MAFVNDYLTEDEIKQFRRLNISYGKKISIVSDKIVGTKNSRVYGGVICTIDRANGMYLFYCGDDSAFGREEFWSPEFFVFVQEKQNETIITRVGMEMLFQNHHTQICWKLYCINTKCYETDRDSDSGNALDDLKAALRVYGINGDPRKEKQPDVVFDF